MRRIFPLLVVALALALAPDALAKPKLTPSKHRKVKKGVGYTATWVEHCDYVFFSASDAIVAAYRVKESCR